jgi:hypothetical protein
MAILTVLQILQTNGLTRYQVFYEKEAGENHANTLRNCEDIEEVLTFDQVFYEKEAGENHANTLRKCEDIEEVLTFEAEWMDTTTFSNTFLEKMESKLIHIITEEYEFIQSPEP